jgi:hypothetical protein
MLTGHILSYIHLNYRIISVYTVHEVMFPLIIYYCILYLSIRRQSIIKNKFGRIGDYWHLVLITIFHWLVKFSAVFMSFLIPRLFVFIPQRNY